MEEEKDLLSWLTNLNLSEYHVTLTSNGYLSPKQLVSIKDRDHLKAIGVVKMGHVSRLLRAIEKFRSDGGGGGGSGDDGGDEDMRMSSPLSQVPESPVPVDGTSSPTKKPPPIPVRKSIRHFPSTPNTSIKPSSRGPPPPVQPRDQSLKRSKPSQSGGSMSMSNLTSPPSRTLASFDALTTDSEELRSLVASSSASLPLPPPPPPKSPTPKPRNKPQPAPRKRCHSKSATIVGSVKDVPNNKVSATLPVGSTLLSNGQDDSYDPMANINHKPSRNIERGQESDHGNVPLPVGIEGATTTNEIYDQPLPPLPHKDPGPQSFAPPPLPPERKYFKENSTPSSDVPSLPKKSPPPEPPTNFLPPSLADHPHHPDRQPPQFKRRFTPEEMKASVPPPRPPQRSKTLATRTVPGDKEEGKPLDYNLPLAAPAPDIHPLPVTRSPAQILSDSEDDEGRGPLISIQSSKPQSDDVLLMSRLSPSAESGDMEMTSSSHDGSPEHVTTLICQQDIGDHRDDFIEINPTDPDYMNQDDVDENINISEDSEDEGVVNRGVVSQRNLPSVDHDDDIIIMNSNDTEDPEYMNQEAIDVDENINISEDSEDEGVVNRGVVSQRNLDHDDDIIMNSNDTEDPEYMNQEAIDVDENINISEDSEDEGVVNRGVVSQRNLDHDDDIIMNSNDTEDPEYMNQEAIDEDIISEEEDGLGGVARRIIGGDIIHQQRTGRDDDDIIIMNSNDNEDPDYINQEAIDEDQEDCLEDARGVVSQTGRPATLIRQQKSGSIIKDHEDDIILMNSNDNEGDYINQEAIDEEEEDRLGDVDSQTGRPTTLIRQQKSGSSIIDHDDDIIIMKSNGNDEDPDYMNQESIDEDSVSEEGDEDRLGGVAKRIIVSQISGPKDDDAILGLTVHGDADPDYMNQNRIDDSVTQESGARDSDYTNQESIDAAAAVVSPVTTAAGNHVYMNQERIDLAGLIITPDRGAASDPDYINQDSIDQSDWAAIEYMNQEMIDLVQAEIQKEEGGEGGGGGGGGEEPVFINQDWLDVKEIKNANNDSYYSDESTEDDIDDDDRIKIHGYREPLQIHGTYPNKSRDPTQKDYENQDVLDGEIIPMVVSSLDEEGIDTSPPPPLPPAPVTPPVPQLMVEISSTLPSSPAIGVGGSDMSLREPKTEAEMSNSNDHPVSHDPTDEPDGLRFPLCSDKPDNETSLDFSCKRASSSRIARPRDKLKKPLSSLAQSASGISPILTKKRALTDADALSVRLLETQSSTASSQATTPSSAGGGDFDTHDPFSSNHDPFHSRDFIPPVLPKSAGTFAGSDYKRPEVLLRKLGSTPENRYSRNSSLYSDLNSSLTESSLLPGLSRLGSTVAQDVPKTKEGFLHKKGGRRNDHPWQKRWVTFDGSVLKYFKNKSDKDNLCLNTVELEKMIDVKRVPDEVDKQYRFDLVVINRVFQLYSSSSEDCQAWVNVLHVAISKFKPQEHEHKEGGSMHDPDKQGYLYKQGRGPFSSKTFKERYVALKGSKFAYYETQEDFRQGRPIHTLEMCLSSVRQDMSSKFPRFLITMHNQKQYLFQSSTDLERNQWIESLTTSIMTGLNLRPQTLPRGGGSKTNNSKDVLDMIQENPSNKTCADCSAVDPLWCVINRGILVCIACSGVHRSFGTHMSKVRSVELDDEIWKNENILKLIVDIGNGESNSFWEKHCKGSRLPADVEKEIREEFIRAKYLTRSWIPVSTVDGSGPSFNDLLCENVATDNLLRTIELMAQGANPCHLLRDVEDHNKNTPLAIARSSGRLLQAELLELNGASICRKEDRQSFSLVSKKGHLYKTGPDRTSWKRRYCTLDQHRGFEYFKTETDGELQGYIHVEEMFSVAKCEEELSKDPKYRHCFEVNTQGRGYLFCADTENELDLWVSAFQKIVSSDAAENLGYDKVGYLKKKDSSGWKKRWFTLKGKNLAFYKREREELDEIDLRTVISLKGSDGNGSPDQHVIQITTDDKDKVSDRVYLLKAESQAEAESWLAALRHTQVSGIPMGEQLLTSNGIPVIVHKCLQFIESTGMDVEGLYRISGEKAKIRKLILGFNQDARGVMIDLDKYTVHDVTGTLKQFFRSLPDPLITHKLYPSFIATIQSDHEAQMYQLQTLIDQLPAANKETLKRMVGHLWRVRENESKNKMSLSNITRLLGPTLMTVDGDPVSFDNTPYEYACIHTMIKYYKWLFHAEDEEKKEEAIEEAVLKIKEAEMMQKKRAELMNQKKSTISSVTNFLTTVYIIGRDGDSYNTNITGTTTVKGVVEEVVSRRELPPDNYALYLVLGDSESHRVLCFTEVLLAVQCSAGTEHFLLLKKNVFWETLKPYLGFLSNGMTVLLHVKEKKRWKKYPCSIVDNHFVQFRDNKGHHGHHEVFKIGVHEFDVFAGIQQSKMDVKNPMPTKYGFWLKATKGEDHSRYLCADKEEDVLKTMAAIVRAKYPHGLETPILPATSSSLSSSPMSPDSINCQSPLSS